MKKKLILVLPEVPCPPRTGGQRIFLENIIDLAESNFFEITIVVLDADSNRFDDAKELRKYSTHFHYFPRTLPRFEKSLKSIFSTLSQIFLKLSHRPFSARLNILAQKKISELCLIYPDAIILAEHLTAMALIPKIYWNRTILITQNVEADVAKDAFLFAPTISILKIFGCIEWIKTSLTEKHIINRVKSIITLSESDSQYFIKKVLCPVHTLTTIIEKSHKTWQLMDSNRILFVGGYKYFPNLDAIHWLCGEFAKEMLTTQPSIKIIIVSDQPKDIAALDNVIFTGFVSTSELEELYRTSRIFICPIKLGSGIKVKLLEAVSYGIPTLASEESVIAINPLDSLPRLPLNNPAVASEMVMNLLNDDRYSQEISDQIIQVLERTSRMKKSLSNIVADIING